VNGTASESYPTADFVISGVEPSGSGTTVLNLKVKLKLFLCFFFFYFSTTVGGVEV
jgi:hypothetical protein